MKAPAPTADTGPEFDSAFRDAFGELIRWRRDVRRFLPDAVPDDLVQTLLCEAMLGPSVGNSQPWRFVLAESEAARRAVRDSFMAANQQALAGYDGDRAELYATLKLAGLDVAPVQVGVFADHATNRGAGLGRATMPEMLDYSVVTAIQTLWFLTRANGLGMGWVSILQPDVVAAALGADKDWRLVAYLCIGYAAEDHLDPELDRAGWEARVDDASQFIRKA